MKLSGETKLFVGIIIFCLILVIGGVALFSKPVTPEPPVPREQLVIPNSPIRGNASASAFLVEFSDFQCPACREVKSVVDSITNKYQDNLLFVYRHFPLDQHTFAQKAAIAAEAAGLQGKFWESYDYLFNNQDKLSDDLINNLGKELSLDEKKYTSDLSDKKLKDKVLADQQAGFSLGINSTPTFYLNGQKLNLTSFSQLDQLVASAINNQ